MPSAQMMKECYKCQKSTLHIQEKANHILHLLISVVTAGLWLIVWLLFIRSGDPKCSICGSGPQSIFLKLNNLRKKVQKK
jgi:hypothetical protein